MNKNTNKTNYAQEERSFLKIILIMFALGMIVIGITNKIHDSIQYKLDEAADMAYEAGYEVGFSEGYESVDPIHNVEDWLSEVEVVDIIEQGNDGTIKLIDGNGDMWILCYEAE